MNRFGQWCLVVLFWVAVFAPARGVGDYSPSCDACKTSRAPVDQVLKIVFPNAQGQVQPPLKLAPSGPQAPRYASNVLNISKPNNSTTNPHGLNDALVGKIAAYMNAKPQERATAEQNILTNHGLEILALCQKAFNNMRYERNTTEPGFCNKNADCTFPDGGPTGRCNATSVGVEHQPLAELSIDYGILIVRGSAPGRDLVIVECKINGNPCACYRNSSKDLSCANALDPYSTNCDPRIDPLVEVPVVSEEPPKDPNLDNLTTDPSAPKE